MRIELEPVCEEAPRGVSSRRWRSGQPVCGVRNRIEMQSGYLGEIGERFLGQVHAPSVQATDR